MSYSVRSRAIASLAIVLATILLTSRFLGQLPESLTNFLVIGGVVLLMLLSFRESRWLPLAKRFALGVGITIIFSTLYLLVPSNDYAVRIFIISILCYAQSRVVRNNKTGLTTMWWILSLTAFFFGTLVALFSFEPIFWAGVQWSSQFLSNMVGNLSRQRMLFDASASGIFVTLIFGTFGVLTLAHSNNDSSKLADFLIYSGELVALNLGFISFLPSLHSWLQGVVSIPQLHIMDFTILLFILDLAPISIYLRKVTFSAIDLNFLPVKHKTLVAISLFVSGFLLMWCQQQPIILDSGSGSTRNGRVLIYDRGVFNWDRPRFGEYGMTSAGMFGMLPSYLKAMGYNPGIDSVFTKQDLDNTDVVLIINLNKHIPQSEKKILEQFVFDGGSLLVIGDHTGLGGIMEPLNSLLDFVDIRYRFDCGHWLVNDWRDAFEYPAHQFFRHVNDESDIAISIGASLDYSPTKARPVLLAKYGFSDLGNSLNPSRAYLGNRRYDPGEKLGDIVLVASAKYGRGKVLVFGDTSPFQNDSLAYSFRFVENVFDWLTTKSPFATGPVRWIANLLMLAGIILLFTIGRATREPSFVVVSMTLISAFLLITGFRGNDQCMVHDSNLPLPIAYIDASHLNSFTHFEDKAIWPLTHNLIRNGYLPIICRKFSPVLLNESRIALFIAPEKELSSYEMKEVYAWMKKGGIVVWSTGMETVDASSAVLARMGLGLENLPLGPAYGGSVSARFAITPVRTTSMKRATSTTVVSEVDSNGMVPEFHSAWPIVVDSDRRVDTLCTGWNYPIIVCEKAGRGKFLLVSDSGFFLSGNLESKTVKPYGLMVVGGNEMVFRALIKNITADDSSAAQVVGRGNQETKEE
ncbi:MAG: hypothetical protein M1469_11885 [Bacteroidetes bacterium]|nr:hypothetical protein [Bacteroidota bacterium]